MADTATITVPMLPETAEMLGRVAPTTGLNIEEVAARALARFAKSQLLVLAGISRGLEDVRRGRVVPHDLAMDEIDEAIRRVGPGRA